MYKQLLIKHFKNSVPNVLCLPIPPCLRGMLAAILILRNTEYPRHFLNGCYFIFHDKAITDSDSQEGCVPLDVSPPEVDLILRQIQCCDERWHRLDTWKTSQLSHCMPFTFSSRLLGLSSAPSFTGSNSNTFRTEDPLLIMCLTPTLSRRIHSLVTCYLTQVSSDSRIIDGSDYFCSQYPAKRTLCRYETTLAWVCGDSPDPIGYIQYISTENADGASATLITGLAVNKSHQRRGFARGLICSVISCMSHCSEIWIAVSASNQAALHLYLKCGFMVKTKQWDSVVTLTVSTQS